MRKLSFRTFCLLTIGAPIGWSLFGQGCPPAIVPPPEPDTQPTEDEFFLGDASTNQNVAIGGQINLTGGGSIGLPKGSPAGVEISFSEGSLKAEAAQRFQEWNPDISLQSTLKITVNAGAQAPQYLIVKLPASDSTARILVSGYIDADTGDQDWAPVPSTYDPQTGLVTAAVGLGLLQPVVQGASTQKPTAVLSGGAGTYTGHVGVGLGGQQFNAQIVFIAEEPIEPLEVVFEGPPIPVSARVGLTLSNITHEPLDSLTVTSDFGPRPSPVQGASTNHQGVDYRAPNSTTVYAAGDGTVVTSRCQNNSVNCGRTATGNITGGYIVEIDHGNGETTRYMHMTNPATVNVGDPDHPTRVTAGQVIGQSDSTGGVAPHLHFEVKKNGTAVDPELIFNQTATATIAMALDYEVQTGTEQQVLVTRGIFTPENMAQYVNIVELTGVEPGQHELQFVIVEPSGTLEVLYAVSLTVGEPFTGLTGAELEFTDITRISPVGDIQYATDRFEVVYSLVAVDESRLQGQAHISLFRFFEENIVSYDNPCPTATYSVGPLEWDAFLEGTYEIFPDGIIHVSFDATPDTGPDYTIYWTNPGCPELDTSDLIPGRYWSYTSVTLVDGSYDYRRDDELDSDETGESYYETHVRWTQPP